MCPPSAVVFLLFTVPKFYEVKKEDCDKVINAAKAKFDEIYKKLDDAVFKKIPKAAAKKQE